MKVDNGREMKMRRIEEKGRREIEDHVHTQSQMIMGRRKFGDANFEASLCV